MKRLLSTAMPIVLAASVTACTITFDTVSSIDNPVRASLTTEGFMFTSIHFHTIDNPELCTFGGCVNNSTVYIMEEAGNLGSPITMTGATGAPFMLTSFAGAQPFLDDTAAASAGFPNATIVSVVGTLAGGGTVSASFALPEEGFQTFTLPSTFANLVSTTFSGSTASGDPGGIALDNIGFVSSAGQTPAKFEGLSFELAPPEGGDPVTAK